jgi:hypothetical protein
MSDLERDLLLAEAAREFEILIRTATEYVAQEGRSREDEMVLAVESAWGWLTEEAHR